MPDYKFKMDAGDIAKIEINGVTLFIQHEGGGISISKDAPDADKCLVYVDMFYLDPRNGRAVRDPVSQLEGCIQALVYDIPGGDPVARAVWHESKDAAQRVVVSNADGKPLDVTFQENGRNYIETVFISEQYGREKTY